MTYGENYRVVVREGLPAKDPDEKLQRSVPLEMFVRDRDASVRFVGKAYVLPKIADATIPVVSVNVDRVNAKVVRIGDRSLVQAIANGDFLSQLGSWQTEDISSRSGEAVWSGSVLIKRETNREVTTAIPVGDVVKTLKPGVYAMTATAENAKDEWGSQATQWFIVTDMGLSSMTGNDGLHAVIRSLTSAKAVAGAKVTLLALNNDVLGTGTTDGEGYVRFDPGLARGTGGAAPALLTAETTDGDFAFLDLSKTAFDLTDRGVDGRPSPLPVDVFLSTERGVYGPARR